MNVLRVKCKIMVISEPNTGGVPRFVYGLIEELANKGHTLIYIYSSRRIDQFAMKYLQDISNKSVRTHDIQIDGKISILRDILGAVKLLWYIFEYEPDSIHANSSKAGFLARICGALSSKNIAIVYAPHGMQFHRSNLYRLLENLAAAVGGYIVAASESEFCNINKSLHLSPKQLKLIPLYPKPQTFYEEHSKCVLSRRKIVSCGRICWDKNPALFFKVAKIVKSIDPTIEFVWIGNYTDDEDSAECKNINGDDKYVFVTGWVENVFHYIRFTMHSATKSRSRRFG